MRALVTGSAGFVGHHMTEELERRGYNVTRCDLVHGRDALDLFAHSDEHFDLVVHAAAFAPNRLAIDTMPLHLAVNVELDAAMFRWAVRTRQDRVLYLSSCAALDGPDDYGWAKLTGERMAAGARRAGLPVTVVRPYSGYSEDQSTDFPFRAITERAKRYADPFPIWGDGKQIRDWIHIDDVVAGALAVVESGTEDAVSLCTGVGTSMTELADLACAEAGYLPRFTHRTDMPNGVARRVGDPSLLHRFYVPQVSLADGVKRAMSTATVPLGPKEPAL